MVNHYRAVPPPKPMPIPAQHGGFFWSLPGGLMLCIAGFFFLSAIVSVGYGFVRQSRMLSIGYPSEMATEELTQFIAAAGGLFLVSMFVSAIGFYLLRRR